jgi:hypothetical protein
MNPTLQACPSRNMLHAAVACRMLHLVLCCICMLPVACLMPYVACTMLHAARCLLQPRRLVLLARHLRLFLLELCKLGLIVALPLQRMQPRMPESDRCDVRRSHAARAPTNGGPTSGRVAFAASADRIARQVAILHGAVLQCCRAAMVQCCSAAGLQGGNGAMLRCRALPVRQASTRRSGSSPC